MIITLSAAPGAEVSSPNEATTCVAQMWIDKMAELYLLAFMLTANKETAEQCMLDAMDEYLNSSAPSLIDWMRNKGRQAVIERAVQRVNPRVKASYGWTIPTGTRSPSAPGHQPFAVITALGTFERFVYVLTVLEGYDEEECAGVLECRRADVVAARKLSHQLVGLGEAEEASPGRLDPLLLVSTMIHSHCGIS
jgi:hypothetical protein